MSVCVLCLRPEQDFVRFGLTFPKSIVTEVRFLASDQEEDIIRAAQDADCIVAPSHRPPITKRIIEKAPRLRLIQLTGAGYNTVDLEAAKEHRITVCNTPGVNARAVAEFTVMSIAMLLRDILTLDAAVKNGDYAEIRERIFDSGLFEFSERHIGIIGLGRIGKEVARICRFLGASVSYFDKVRLSHEDEKILGVRFLPLLELLPVVDVLTVHVPLEPSTVNLITWRELNLLKPGAVVVNICRGGIINEIDLARAIEEGVIRGAAVDAFVQEPLPRDHPFLHLSPSARNRLILSPHLGGATMASRRKMLEFAIENVTRFFKGEELSAVIV